MARDDPGLVPEGQDQERFFLTWFGITAQGFWALKKGPPALILLPALRSLFLRCVAGWHERGREVHPRQIRFADIGFAQDRNAHIRAAEFRAIDLRIPEIGVPQQRTLKVRVRQIATEKLDPARSSSG